LVTIIFRKEPAARARAHTHTYKHTLSLTLTLTHTGTTPLPRVYTPRKLQDLSNRSAPWKKSTVILIHALIRKKLQHHHKISHHPYLFADSFYGIEMLDIELKVMQESMYPLRVYTAK